MTVNMKDIARDLGVSIVTVSKALRDHPDVSDTMRERIHLKVKELGYRPNLTARSLVTGRSSLIGLIVPDLIHPFFAEVAKGLSLAVRQHGYFLVMSSSEEDPLLEQQEVEHMLAHRLDAMVIASCQTNDEFLRKLRLGDTPLILIDRFFKDLPFHFVGSDDYAAGRLAAEHLLAIGCRRPAHIRGPENSVGIRRLKGFTDALKKQNIDLPEDYILRVLKVDVGGRTSGVDAFRRLMDLAYMPDGVFCYNDVIAVGVIGEARSQGMRVPEDLAVIGCGNLHYDNEISVPLSSIDQRSSEIGSRTAKLILGILTDKGTAVQQRVILKPHLIARASTESTKSNFAHRKLAGHTKRIHAKNV